MTRKQELTPWFPREVKPARVGWYDTNKYELGGGFEESAYRWWWDGDMWLHEPDGSVCAFQGRAWRGLTSGGET